MISLIVATDLNNLIAKNGKIPWKCSEDLKHFKQTTLNSIIIMGRKTFDSLPGILPNRTHIVISRNYYKFKTKENVYYAANLESAISLAKNLNKEIFVIGGKQIYDLSLNNNYIDKIYLSIIKITVEEGVENLYFNFPREQYSLDSVEDYKDFILQIWEKRK